MVDKTQFTSFGASGLVELITHKEFRMMLLLDDLGAIAQLVERMTVNHDVTGSRPVGGVNRLIAKTQATNRGLAVSLKKKRTK